MTGNGELESAVAAFSNAEAALVQLAERSERATAITQELTQARADIESLSGQLRRDFEEALLVSELKSAERIEEQVNHIRSATSALTSAASASNDRVAKELAVFAEAGEILDRAGRDLTTAERVLADARSDIREMILVHSDISRELKLAATALAALRPEGLALRLDDIEAAAGTAETRVLQGLETSSATHAGLVEAQAQSNAERHQALMQKLNDITDASSASESRVVQSIEAASSAQAELAASQAEIAARAQQTLATRLAWVIALLVIALVAVVGFGVALLLN